MIKIDSELGPTDAVDIDLYFKKKYSDSGFYLFLSATKKEHQCTFLLQSSDDKLAKLYNICIKLHAGAYNILSLCQEQVRIMNRISETETDWITEPLWFVCHQMIQYCSTDTAQLENCGRLIHRSFNLCLNDRNPVLSSNRKSGSYSLANLEFIIYHKLKNRDMMKNLVKVLQSRNMDIIMDQPSNKEKNSIKVGHMVRYYYYLGEYYGCFESDFNKASTFLSIALLHCNFNYKTHIAKILVLLVPFVIVSRKMYPNEKVLTQLLSATGQYGEKLFKFIIQLVYCLKSGDIHGYDKFVSSNEVFLLKNGIYVAMCHIRELVFLKFFKTCTKMIGNNKTIVPLSSIAEVYGNYSQRKKKIRRLINMKSKKDTKIPIDITSLENKEMNENMDELECLLANLINKGFIKGYLSHSNRCIVLSKNDAFPHLSSSL
ncbi:hypothetical protein TPHA_0E00580 [Tetrapisispora phaffii CBS 4417]|uniref:PCI domain-containing protein n=1 Tax=Tetrapisispora phaffii (strain ATCC 24235 / CBS 4417 / NBRC 1672 / NRRL Y-8282 / UCD 70-5) TaxID=1071381 RepID=G8BTC5_TETPH|nr:hypothetical protein TPHA_0E00580 [Tetrapisispora phaffii CBS 4417]CCE63153.1 hypothetical protein TPHA_0E00580 [Tetrapisispora phaffii CBS 4417]